MSLTKSEQIDLKELHQEAVHLSKDNNNNIYKVRYLHNTYSIVKFSKKIDNTHDNYIHEDNTEENNIQKDNTEDNNTQ